MRSHVVMADTRAPSAVLDDLELTVRDVREQTLLDFAMRGDGAPQGSDYSWREIARKLGWEEVDHG
jgi:hypothetical protein